MVAILQPNRQPTPAPRSGRQHLRLVADEAAASSAKTALVRPAGVRPAVVRPASVPPVLVAAGIIGLLLVVVVLRMVQGGPPASTWAEIGAGSGGSSAAVTDIADVVLVVEPGDTWWAIAEEFAPGVDTVEVVRVLTAANGGPSLDAGQQIVIPASVRG